MAFPFDSGDKETTFRFKFGGSIVLFTEKGMFVFAKPRSLANFIILVAIGMVPTYILQLFIHASSLPFLTVGLFWIPLIYDLVTWGFRWFRGRRMSKLSDQEIIQKAESKGWLIQWEEIRGLDLHAKSLTVTWGRGVMTRKMRLKFDPSIFDKLKLFLAPRMGEKLGAVRDLEAYLQEKSAQSFGIVQREPFQINLRRYVLLALVGGAFFAPADYFAASLLFLTGQQAIFYPRDLVDISTVAGLALCIISVIYLSSSAKELVKIDRARFKFLPLIAYGTLACLALFGGISFVSDLLISSSNFFIVSFIGGIVLLEFGIILLGILTARLVRRIGPLYNKWPLILVAIVLSGSLFFSIFVPLAPIVPSAGASLGSANRAVVNVTTVNLYIHYQGGYTNTWLGPAYQPETGGAIVVHGGQSFSETTTFHALGGIPPNITKITIPTSNFTFISSSPAVPFIEDSGTFNVTVSMYAPEQNYSGPIEIDFYIA